MLVHARTFLASTVRGGARGVTGGIRGLTAPEVRFDQGLGGGGNGVHVLLWGPLSCIVRCTALQGGFGQVTRIAWRMPSIIVIIFRRRPSKEDNPSRFLTTDPV